MPSSPWPDRRRALGAGAALLAGAWQPARADERVRDLLRAGGVVVAFRHALAPGTFDPPGFTLGDCSTQRNLSEDGRAQARRIGAWFKAGTLVPARVRSSPWCRCIDTATLAFGGEPERWAALGSPRGSSEQTNVESLQKLRAALRAVAGARGGNPRFEAWVTHMFVLSALTGENSASGEGLVLAPGPGDAVRVLARLSIS